MDDKEVVAPGDLGDYYAKTSWENEWKRKETFKRLNAWGMHGLIRILWVIIWAVVVVFSYHFLVLPFFPNLPEIPEDKLNTLQSFIFSGILIRFLTDYYRKQIE